MLQSHQLHQVRQVARENTGGLGVGLLDVDPAAQA